MQMTLEVSNLEYWSMAREIMNDVIRRSYRGACFDPGSPESFDASSMFIEFLQFMENQGVINGFNPDALCDTMAEMCIQ